MPAGRSRQNVPRACRLAVEDTGFENQPDEIVKKRWTFGPFATLLRVSSPEMNAQATNARIIEFASQLALSTITPSTNRVRR